MNSVRRAAGSDATNGARCAKPVRYAVIASGVASPESTVISATSMSSRSAASAQARSNPGVFDRGSVRVLSWTYQSGGRYPNSRATSSMTSFDARASAAPNTVAITRPRGRITRRISSNARSGASMCEIANPLTAASKQRSVNGSAHMSPATARSAASPTSPSMSGEVSTANGTAPTARSARHKAPVPAPTSSTEAP